MSHVVVVTFDNLHEAGEVRRTLQTLQREHLLDIEDAAVAVRDSSGKVHVDNETSHGVKVGVSVGGLAGLLVLFLFPGVGLAVGAVGGALVAKFMDLGIDQQFVTDGDRCVAAGQLSAFGGCQLSRSCRSARCLGALQRDCIPDVTRFRVGGDALRYAEPADLGVVRR